MKSLGKLVVLMLGGLLLANCAGGNNDSGSGSGPNASSQSEDTSNLYLYILTRGYGTEWLKEMGKAFEAAHSGVSVHFKEGVEATSLNNEMDKGPGKNDYDLFFNLTGNHTIQERFANKWGAYPSGLLDLTEIFQETIPGENQSILQKMNPSFSKYLNNGTSEAPAYYEMPWASGLMGLTYNVNVFTEAYGSNYQSHFPKTTNELLALAQELKTKGINAFVYPQQIDYFSSSVFYAWWKQYEGTDNWERFYQGKAYDEISGDYVISKDIFAQTGRQKAIEAMGKLIDYDAGYCYDKCYNYGTNNFRNLQTAYLNHGQGTLALNAAMYPCGDWLGQEASDTASDDFGFMKTPVISSIVDRLTTVKTDAQLSEVISYVDGEITKDGFTSSYSDEDIAAVEEARRMIDCDGLNHLCYAPAYTNAKTLVKEFLQFMASDAGIKIYKENVKGGFLPFTYDYKDMSLSTFESGVAALIPNLSYSGSIELSPLFYKGHASGVCYSGDESSIESHVGSQHSSVSYLTPSAAYQAFFYTDSQWQDLLTRSGLGS